MSSVGMQTTMMIITIIWVPVLMKGKRQKGIAYEVGGFASSLTDHHELLVFSQTDFFAVLISFKVYLKLERYTCLDLNASNTHT